MKAIYASIWCTVQNKQLNFFCSYGWIQSLPDWPPSCLFHSQTAVVGSHSGNFKIPLPRNTFYVGFLVSVRFHCFLPDYWSMTIGHPGRFWGHLSGHQVISGQYCAVIQVNIMMMIYYYPVHYQDQRICILENMRQEVYAGLLCADSFEYQFCSSLAT